MNSRTGSIDLNAIKARLVAGTGGYEVAHESPSLELGVHVLVAPEPDQQQPHADDEVYVALEGRGTLEIDGTAVPVTEGQAVFGSGRRRPPLALPDRCVAVDARVRVQRPESRSRTKSW